MIKRFIAAILTVSMLCALIPTVSFADNDTYSIANKYIQYSINTKTGGFAIKTDEGHPDKRYDNNMPLLYKAAEGSDETSFVTVRIDGQDYIFGREYGFFGINSQLSQPVISNEGRLIETVWTIKGYEVTQKVAISLDEDTDLTGNVGVSYAVKNTNSKSGNVGIRILYDAALGNEVDAPYITADSEINPIITEREFSGDSMPSQLRAVDSITNATKASYLLFSGWNVDYSADKVIVGHWANLANTRYDYTPDTYCDFTNYSNEYRIPDTAYAIYWTEKALAAGSTRTAEMLYGVGNFSKSTAGTSVGLDVQTERVRLNDSGSAYKNNGEFKVNVNFDNSVDGSIPLKSATVTLTADDGLTLKSQKSFTYANVTVGQIYDMEFTVQAAVQTQITSKQVHIMLSGMDMDGNVIAENASRYILLPGIKNAPNIQFNRISPKIVYTSGEKYVTVSGDFAPLAALRGSDEWDLFLKHTISDLNVRIEKQNITFAEDYSSFTFKTEEELAVGKYDIILSLRDRDIVSNFGVSSIKSSVQLEVSADKKYAVRSYGVVALVRYSKNKYKFISFNDEAEYKSFVEGKTSFEGIKNNFSTGYKTGAANTDEILITVRGNVKQLEKDGKTYYSAESSENDITINNMLSYKSDEPLVMSESNGKYTVYGNGEIKVINSITVWKNEWSFNASENKVYTLNPDAVKQPSTQQMTLSLDGAAFLIQSIGGFLIDLKYGVMTADSDDGLITHGISFGGKISIPIKDPTKKKDNPNPQTQGGNNNNDDDDEDYSEDLTQLFGESEGDRYTTSAVTNRSDFKKDTNFSDGNLSAEIESILYGEKTGEKDGQTVVTDTGFIGINTKISLGLPEDILGKFVENAPGVYASVTINTIDNYYELSAGLKIKVIECEGTLAFKQVNVKDKDVIVPDKIEFYVREGLKIPLAPPLFITGLGGGINGLADTIGGEFDALPPITLLLFARLELIETMIGDFNAAISLSGIDLQGDMKLKNDKKGQVLNLQLGISARWIDPWHLSAYGKISVIDGLIKGTVALIIADNLFYGYAAIAICIPDSVPIIGGKELAGIEAAVSNEFIGANIKIIGIKFGVIYYWSGKFDYGTGIDLAPPMLTSTPEDNGSAGSGEDYTALYGTNIHKLSATKVENTGVSLLAAGQSSVTKNFDPEREDALLIEIPFEGTVMPEMEDITLTDPSGNVIPLVADDGNGNGNFLTQSREDGDYIYISITDPSQLKKGDWTVTVTSDYGRIKDFGIYGADSIPEVTSTTFAPRSNVNSRDVKVSWTKSMDYDADTSVDIYVTENPNALEDAKASQSGVKDAFGTSMAHFDYAGVDNCDITLPESFPSGDYYVVTMLSSAKSGISTAISAQPFKFVNNNLPNPIKSAKLYYAGNKALCLNIEDADTVDYTDYLINIIASDGTAVTNSFTQLDKDSELVIGENSELEKGKTYHVEISTLKETDDGKFYYGAEKVVSNDYTIPDVAMPNLISVQTNAENGALTSNTLSVTYKFDGPVYVRSLINGVDTPTGDTNEFKDTWTMTADLVDGDYLIDFKAYNTAKDYVTGENFADIANSTIGLTVDTQAPVLTLTQDVKKNVQNKDAIFGNNVVRAASNGLYTITGLTENDVTLTADGSDENVTIGENNTFTVTGTLETGEMKKEVELRAVDKVGNTSTLIVSVLPDITSYREIKIKSGGQEISKNADGDKVIELQRFERVPLEVYGVRADGKEVLIDPEDVTWMVLDEKNLIALDDTGAKALRSGTATFKASVGSMLLEDGANISTGQEDYVLFSVNNIVGTEMEVLPNFAQTMVLSKANDEDGVRLIAQLKDDAHGDLPVMRAYVATYDDNGKLINVNSTAFDTSDTVKVTKPAQANYKVFVWADGVGPVIKAITNKTTGVNKLFD